MKLSRLVREMSQDERAEYVAWRQSPIVEALLLHMQAERAATLKALLHAALNSQDAAVMKQAVAYQESLAFAEFLTGKAEHDEGK